MLNNIIKMCFLGDILSYLVILKKSGSYLLFFSRKLLPFFFPLVDKWAQKPMIFSDLGAHFFQIDKKCEKT